MSMRWPEGPWMGALLQNRSGSRCPVPDLLYTTVVSVDENISVILKGKPSCNLIMAPITSSHHSSSF